MLAMPALAYSGQEISAARTANAWCSFSYNWTAGYSHSKRVMFGGNSILTVKSNNEGGSSGYGGSHYGQSSGGNSCGWRVMGGVLYLSEGGDWGARTGCQVQFQRQPDPDHRRRGMVFLPVGRHGFAGTILDAAAS